MGHVYQAHDLELRREVALKVIAPRLAADPSAVERFKREIQLSSLVSHPNVLRVYDLGESEGLRFLTMQYVEGETLAEEMRREGRVPLLRAVSIFRQICDGLGAAHGKGVLHRDSKPQNILVDPSGGTYLSDFGLAVSSSLSPLTQTGVVLGTPRYMSPEQVKGEPLDARSDIFTLGIILYEMLTGVPPYAGDTPNEVMFRRTKSAPPRATALNPDIPAHLQRILDRCLAVEPRDRYGTVQEILADLDPAVDRAAPALPAEGGERAPSRIRALASELRRRKVLTTALAYLVAAFGLLQGAEVVVRTLELPQVIMTVSVVVLAVGLPVSMVLSWFLDLRPESASGGRPGSAGAAPGTGRRPFLLRRPTQVLLGLLALGSIGLAAWRFWPRTEAILGPQSVLIADMENRTGEPVFDGTLEPALGIALEGASFVTTYNRESARKIADQLRLDGSGLTEKRARLVAQREGIHVVTAGAIDCEGGKYRVAIRASDAFTGKPITERVEVVPGKESVLSAVSKLAARVRHALGDATPEAAQLREAETFSAASIEAAHAYGIARKLERDGNYEGAKKNFLEAVRLDPGMGRAWVGLANIEGNRGRHGAADKYFQEAMTHLDRMSEREKYRSRGAYHLQGRDADKAIEALGVLVREYPADSSGLANLAVAYQLRREFGRALEVARQASAIYPKNVPQRNNVGLFAMYGGHFEEAIRVQREVVEASPGFVNGYIGLALAQLAAGDRDAALATWGKLQGLGEDGASAATKGLADSRALRGAPLRCQGPPGEGDRTGPRPQGPRCRRPEARHARGGRALGRCEGTCSHDRGAGPGDEPGGSHRDGGGCDHSRPGGGGTAGPGAGGRSPRPVFPGSQDVRRGRPGRGSAQARRPGGGHRAAQGRQHLERLLARASRPGAGVPRRRRLRARGGGTRDLREAQGGGDGRVPGRASHLPPSVPRAVPARPGKGRVAQPVCARGVPRLPRDPEERRGPGRRRGAGPAGGGASTLKGTSAAIGCRPDLCQEFRPAKFANCDVNFGGAGTSRKPP